jgi:predicted S18 family serine protease
MRSFVLSLAIVLGFLMIPAADAGNAVSAAPALSAVVHAADSAELSQPPQINVEVSKGGGRWYASPVWIAIGVIGGVLVLMLIVMALKGGTTVVK